MAKAQQCICSASCRGVASTSPACELPSPRPASSVRKSTHGYNCQITFKTRLASAETSCPSSPNRLSTATATQFFPAMARQEPPLSSRGFEEANDPPLRAIVAANTIAVSRSRRVEETAQPCLRVLLPQQQGRRCFPFVDHACLRFPRQ